MSDRNPKSTGAAATKPTIVLVHGALTDASVWNGVAELLQGLDYPTIAPAMPLRSLGDDVDYLDAFLGTIEGPVVLVAHSYGGTVISHPRLDRDPVVGLVYAAAFQPDAGETTAELNYRFPGSKLGEDTTEVRQRPGGADLYLRPADFAEVYAADVPTHTRELMAHAQRPIDPAALNESFDGVPSWRRIPSWAVVSTSDNSLPPEAERFMARRAGSTAIEVDASHAVPVSRPAEIAAAIRAAAEQ
jgi:pimeloyl-ACP methyl ester carboxylesterase